METFGNSFFRKKYLVKKLQNARKPKRGHLGSLNVFYKLKTSKNCKGVPFERTRKFSKKVAYCRKTHRGDPLVSPVVLEALKNLWFSARIEPRSPASQKISRSEVELKNEHIVRKGDHSE